MNDVFANTLTALAYDFIHILSLLVLILSLIVGILLLLKPALIIQWNDRFQKSYSMRQQTRSLELARNLDHYFYRHHRFIGTTITLVSGYIFYYFSMSFQNNMFSIIFSGYSPVILDLLADWLRILMLFVSTLTLIIGLTILFRPSGLKGFERWANRWISTRQAARPLTRQYHKLDQLLLSYPRMLGIIIVLFSVYAALGLILIYN